MTLDDIEAAFQADLARALGDYDGDRVDIDLRIRDADLEKLLWARSVLGTRSRVRQDDIDGMWRALAMHFIFKQHATQHRMDMAALLPARSRDDDP
jgi:hypothetical protein